jgi:hypothetical protein
MHPKGFIYDYWNHSSDLSAGNSMANYFAVGNTHRATK